MANKNLGGLWQWDSIIFLSLLLYLSLSIPIYKMGILNEYL